MFSMSTTTPQQWREIVFFTLISLLFCYPIIHANVYFADDLWRITSAMAVWETLGRPGATLVSFILSLSSLHSIVDVAPLTQLLAAAFLAMSAYKFNEYIKLETGRTYPWASALLIVNPFFLYNLSYRYDSLAMALGLMLTVWAFSLPFSTQRPKIKSIFILFAALTLYQSDINLFIALAACEIVLLMRSTSTQALLVKLGWRIAQYVIAFALYYLTIGQILSAGAQQRSSIIAINTEGMSILQDNIMRALELSATFLTPMVLFYLAITTLLLLFVTIRGFLRSDRAMMELLWIFLAIVGCVIALFGPMILLKACTITYRTQPAFYGLALLMGLLAAINCRRYHYIAMIPLLLAIASSYQYGNAMKNQRDYDKVIIQHIHYDLVDKQLDEKTIYIIGALERAPHAEVIAQVSPFIAASISPAGGWIAASLLFETGLEETQFLWSPDYNELIPSWKDDICLAQLSPIVNKKFYQIYTSNSASYVMLTSEIDHFCQITDNIESGE